LVTFLIIACTLSPLQTVSQRLYADLPDGTEITEPGTFMGSLSDTGSKTSFPHMPFSYYDWKFFWIKLNHFDILALELQMDHWVDLDLGVWSSDESFVATSVGGGHKVEEIAFISGLDMRHQIFIGCFSGRGSYSLTVEVERVKTISGSGNVTGIIEEGSLIGENDLYKLELRGGDAVVFTLSPPVTEDFNIQVFNEADWNITTGKAQDCYEAPQGVGEQETVELIIPRDGVYIMRIYSVHGEGVYLLHYGVSSNPGLIANMNPIIFYIVIGVFSIILIGILIIFRKDRIAQTPRRKKDEMEKIPAETDQEIMKIKKQIEELDQLLIQKRVTKRAYEKVRSELEQKLKQTGQK